MKLMNLKISLGSIIVMIISNIANASPFADSTPQEAKIKAYEILGTETATISFAAGSSDLTENERKTLAAIITAVRNNAVISSAIVAAWSDLDYPMSKEQQQSKAARKLADERIKKIDDALQGMGVRSVETHSMAEHPTWLAKFFNTEDAKLKGEGKIIDANDQLITSIGRTLREKGGPGRAVVIIRRQGDVSAP